MNPVQQLVPNSVVSAGIDELKINVYGQASYFLARAILNNPPAKWSTPIVTEAGTIELSKQRRRPYRRRDDITRYYDTFAIRTHHQQRSMGSISWECCPDESIATNHLEWYMNIRQTTQRFDTSDDLLFFIRAFVHFVSLDDIAIRQTDYHVDPVVPEREHFETVCPDRRYQYTVREWDPKSRKFGAPSSGQCRTYDKEQEMLDRYGEPYIDPNIIPLGHTVQRVEAGCRSRRLKGLLGLDRNSWLMHPDKRVKYWHQYLPPVGPSGIGPFFMFKKWQLRQGDLPPTAKLRDEFRYFQQHLPRCGVKAAYDFAAANGVVRTWFQPVPLAEVLAPSLLERLDEFFSPLRHSEEVAKLIQAHEQYRREAV